MNDAETNDLGFSSEDTPVLPNEEGAGSACVTERQVARQFLYGKKAYSLLSKKQVVALAERIAQGDRDAFDQLVMHNIGLVRSVAFIYQWSGIPLDDLVQEGIFGLMIAAQRYDPSLGAFSTKAYLWIRSFVVKAVFNSGQTIRVPIHTQERMNKMLGHGGAKPIEQGKALTQKQLAERLGLSEQQVRELVTTLSLRNVASLDQPPPGERGIMEDTLGELVADPYSPEPSTILEARDELREIAEKIAHLLAEVSNITSARDYQMFVLYYGFGTSEKQKTLREVGDCFGLTGEGARQVIKKIWRGLESDSGVITRSELLRCIDGIPLLEEIAQATMSWENIMPRRDLPESRRLITRSEEVARVG